MIYLLNVLFRVTYNLLIYQMCQIPRCLVALQRSVYTVLIGRTQAPDWLTHGIPQLARTSSAVVSLVDTQRPAAAETSGTSIASDGHFLYVHDPLYGLLKIGCGYGNTIMVCTCAQVYSQYVMLINVKKNFISFTKIILVLYWGLGYNMTPITSKAPI